jgi:hypothetical protein
MEAKRMTAEERMFFLKGNERGEKARVSLVDFTAASLDADPNKLSHVTVPTMCQI